MSTLPFHATGLFLTALLALVARHPQAFHFLVYVTHLIMAECRYITVKYNTILNTARQSQMSNLSQTSHSWRHPIPRRKMSARYRECTVQHMWFYYHYVFWDCVFLDKYRQTSNIRHTLVGKKIVDHSDVFGASPVGAAPTTSSFSTQYLISMDWTKTTARRDNKHLNFGFWCALY